MAIYRAQHILPMFTGIPRDVISNTFHFEADGSLSTAVYASVIQARLNTFYETAYEDLGATYVVWSAATVEVVRLDDPPPLIPIVLSSPVVTTPTDSVIPTEVSVVNTFAAAETGGVVRQRLYNRVYLGGWADGVMQAGLSSAFPQVSVLAMSQIANASSALLFANDGAPDWIQYSPTAGVARPITRGWIDNSPDTQRRRSVDATNRNTWEP